MVCIDSYFIYIIYIIFLDMVSLNIFVLGKLVWLFYSTHTYILLYTDLRTLSAIHVLSLRAL